LVLCEHRMANPGSACVPRAGFGVPPKRTFGIFRRFGRFSEKECRKFALARRQCQHARRVRSPEQSAFSVIPLWIKDLGRCPTAIKLSLEALATRARSQAPAWECSIPGGSSLLPGLQKHSAPERNGRLEPPRQGRSQAGAWERDREPERLILFVILVRP